MTAPELPPGWRICESCERPIHPRDNSYGQLHRECFERSVSRRALDDRGKNEVRDAIERKMNGDGT